jgi:hypothetical protein
VEILAKFCQKPLHDLVQALEEVLVKSSQCPCRSLWEDLVEILLDFFLKRSLHQYLEDPLHWCLHENDFGILKGNSCMKIL